MEGRCGEDPHLCSSSLEEHYVAAHCAYQTGLLSASVAAIIVESYKWLQPDSSGTTVVRVRTLWFLSLTLCLICALLAALTRQCVEHYLQRWDALCEPMPGRTFFAKVIERIGLPRAVKTLEALGMPCPPLLPNSKSDPLAGESSSSSAKTKWQF